MDGFGVWLGSLIDFVIQVERDHSGREERFGWLVCFRSEMMLRETNIRRTKGEYICVEVERKKRNRSASPPHQWIGRTSLTFSSTILACLSNALTLANNFLLFLKLIKICDWFLTACCRTERGPWEISYSSSSRIWASSNSDLGTWAYWLFHQLGLGRIQSYLPHCIIYVDRWLMVNGW